MSDDLARRLARKYDLEAEAYESLWAPLLRPPALALLSELGHRAQRVLDVGSGTGSLLPDLRDTFPGATVVGVDRSPGMLARAPRGFPRVVTDGALLAFVAESFDVVLFAFMLFHLADPGDGLREAYRVLRPGGRVGAVTWGSEVDSMASTIWDEELDAYGAPPLAESHLARHELVDTPEKMAGLLEQAGFESVRSWTRDHELALDADLLIALRTRFGRAKLRYDGLGPREQRECLARAAGRLAALDTEDFVGRSTIVFTTGLRPSF